MSYKYIRDLKLNDTDRTTFERHLTGTNKQNILPRNFIHKIQERFHELGFGYMVGNINGCFNVKLYSVILAFQNQSLQKKRNIFNFHNEKIEELEIEITFKGTVNGFFDRATAHELNIWLENNYRNSAQIPLIKWGKTWIRKQIADKINRVKNQINDLGGVFPTNSIACFRSPANTTISVGMKKTSLHLAALAIDLDEWRGMQNPSKDYYFISDRDGEYWDVFVKTENSNFMHEREFFFFNSEKKNYYTKTIKGGFINVSDLMFQQGLIPIKRKKGWENEFYYSEWWHFQDKNASDENWVHSMNEIGFYEKFLASQNYK